MGLLGIGMFIAALVQKAHGIGRKAQGCEIRVFSGRKLTETI
jgi:hypothetical protein